MLLLIRCLGANPRAVNRMGCTALHAASAGTRSCALLTLVCTFELQIDAFTYAGETPLFIASFEGHTGTALSLINDLGALVDAAGESRATPLTQAVTEGHTGTALLLINLGACVEATTRDDCTPLHFACFLGLPVTVTALLA